MTRLTRALLLASGLSAATAYACPEARVLSYDDKSVYLQGTASIAQARHPNGAKMRYPIMRLDRPITIMDHEDSATCIKEIQLVSGEKLMTEKLLKLKRSKLSATGELFQEHTAWHMRKVLMNVKSVYRLD